MDNAQPECCRALIGPIGGDRRHQSPSSDISVPVCVATAASKRRARAKKKKRKKGKRPKVSSEKHKQKSSNKTAAASAEHSATFFSYSGPAVMSVSLKPAERCRSPPGRRQTGSFLSSTPEIPVKKPLPLLSPNAK